MNAMKTLIAGIVLIIIIGVGGLVYRNVLEHSGQPVACPVSEKTCPDGTKISTIGLSCTFPVCPPPNVTLADVGISFALPDGYAAAPAPDSTSVAAYDNSSSSASPNSIIIRRYPLDASSSPLTTIQQTAIGGASGAPVSPTSFTSTEIHNRQFTIVTIERFEGAIDIAYYLVRAHDVLRFDAIDRGIDWTNPNLDTATLPSQLALRRMLGTLQAE